jgi:hypothetical protein
VQQQIKPIPTQQSIPSITHDGKHPSKVGTIQGTDLWWTVKGSTGNTQTDNILVQIQVTGVCASIANSQADGARRKSRETDGPGPGDRGDDNEYYDYTEPEYDQSDPEQTNGGDGSGYADTASGGESGDTGGSGNDDGLFVRDGDFEDDKRVAPTRRTARSTGDDPSSNNAGKGGGSTSRLGGEGALMAFVVKWQQFNGLDDQRVRGTGAP